MNSLRDYNLWLCGIVIAYIAVILFFSSGRNSVSRTAPLFVRAFEPLFLRADSKRIVRSYIVIRKLFHLTAYAILALLTSATFYNSGFSGIERNWHIYSFAVVLCVAATDETLQYFNPDRVGSVQDVILDCIGGLGAIVVFWIVAGPLS